MSNEAIILVIGTLGMVFMAGGLVLFAFFYQQKMNRKQLELRETKAMLNDMELTATYQFLEGQQEEKKRIAAELHDQIGSQLAILRLQLSEKLNHDAAFGEHFIEAVNHILQMVRGVSHDLNRGVFHGQKLNEAIEMIVDQISGHTNMRIDYASSGIEDLGSEQLGIALFRIIQELISNTLKYAGATQIHIDLNYFKGEYLTLIYQDDGRGFDTDIHNNGMGHASIRNRLAPFDGKFFINSTPGKGVEAVVEINQL